MDHVINENKIILKKLCFRNKHSATVQFAKMSNYAWLINFNKKICMSFTFYNNEKSFIAIVY